MRHRIILFLLLLNNLSLEAYASEFENNYGKFIETKAQHDYIVTFILNPTNEEFKKIRAVSMVNYGDDENGDVSIVSYKRGDEEIFFRNWSVYRRYVSHNTAADVCEESVWPWWVLPKKIVYQKNKWECLNAGIALNQAMWPQIDDGFSEAKKNEWSALTERILENVKRIAKK
jgi:hypothetical protein